MRVVKWGNSLAIRLPATVVEVLDLKEGDEIGSTRPGCARRPSFASRTETT